MSYHNLSQQELIKLLEKRDTEITVMEEKLQDAHEHIQHFISDKHNNLHDLIDSVSLEEYSESNIDFDDLTIETDESDNTREVSKAKDTFSELVSYSNELSVEVFDMRYKSFLQAVDDLVYCIDNKIPYNIEDFNIFYYSNLDYKYKMYNSDDRDHSRKLSILVDKISLEELYSIFPQDSHFFNVFDTQDSKHITILRTLIANLLSEDPLLSSFENLEMKERENILIKKFPQLPEILSLKEKREIMDNIKEISDNQIDNKRRI